MRWIAGMLTQIIDMQAGTGNQSNVKCLHEASSSACSTVQLILRCLRWWSGGLINYKVILCWSGRVVLDWLAGWLAGWLRCLNHGPHCRALRPVNQTRPALAGSVNTQGGPGRPSWVSHDNIMTPLTFTLHPQYQHLSLLSLTKHQTSTLTSQISPGLVGFALHTLTHI